MAEDELPELDKYRIASLPYGLYYISQFITAEEERSLLDKIPDKRWTELSHRRLQSHPSPLAKNQALIQAPLVEWLQKPCVEKMIQLGIWANAPHKAANHCLINQFYPQAIGLMTGIDLAHEDGPAYYPIVTTVSLGSHIILNILPKSDKTRKIRILQEPGSLLITTGQVYTDYLHEIEEVSVDENLNEDTIANWSLLTNPEQWDGSIERKTRTSLTFRDVLKVVRIKF